MRVLAVQPGPAFSVLDVHNGWVRALRRSGVTVVDFDLSQRLDFYCMAVQAAGETDPQTIQTTASRMVGDDLCGAAYQVAPDVVLITSGFYVPPGVWELLRIRGSKVVFVGTESPYEDDLQLGRAAVSDIAIINDPINLDRYRDVQPRTFYRPHAYDPSIHRPRPADPDLVADFAFVGTGFPSRVEWFEKVDWSGIDAALYGNWTYVSDDSPLLPLLAHKRGECVANSDTARIYTSVAVGLNLYRAEGTHDASWAMGPREVEMAACGLPFIRTPRGEGDDILAMLPVITEPAEFGDVLSWLLEHPDVRARLAAEARDAIADRTFDVHAAWLLAELDR
jgi:spore maturation protein CgeB